MMGCEIGGLEVVLERIREGRAESPANLGREILCAGGCGELLREVVGRSTSK